MQSGKNCRDHLNGDLVKHVSYPNVPSMSSALQHFWFPELPLWAPSVWLCGFGLDRMVRWVVRCIVILGLGKAGGGLEYVGC